MVIKQYDIFVVVLDPALGAEVRKRRPCIVISPEEMNAPLRTVQIAPMTTNVHHYPWRVPISFQKQSGMVALDQLRTVDRKRLVRRVGRASRQVIEGIKHVIHEMLVR